MEHLPQQDGRKRDEYFSDLSRKLFESLRDLSNAKERMEQTCRKWVLITATVSVASSTLACVLCLLLADLPRILKMTEEEEQCEESALQEKYENEQHPTWQLSM